MRTVSTAFATSTTLFLSIPLRFPICWMRPVVTPRRRIRRGSWRRFRQEMRGRDGFARWSMPSHTCSRSGAAQQRRSTIAGSSRSTIWWPCGRKTRGSSMQRTRSFWNGWKRGCSTASGWITSTDCSIPRDISTGSGDRSMSAQRREAVIRLSMWRRSWSTMSGCAMTGRWRAPLDTKCSTTSKRCSSTLAAANGSNTSIESCSDLVNGVPGSGMSRGTQSSTCFVTRSMPTYGE